MKLIVGLGNPGSSYRRTRHNVGFEVIDALSVRLGLAGEGQFDALAREQFAGLCVEGTLTVGSELTKVILLKPQTYMNLSGQSVQSAMAFYKIAPTDLLVVLDDVALPAGRIRLRPSGSSGGHNGLRDIERALGGLDYPRLRLGIDAPPPYMEQKDYVLGRFTPEQQKAMQTLSIPRAVDCIICWMEYGVQAAMTRFNSAANGTEPSP